MDKKQYRINRVACSNAAETLWKIQTNVFIFWQHIFFLLNWYVYSMRTCFAIEWQQLQSNLSAMYVIKVILRYFTFKCKADWQVLEQTWKQKEKVNCYHVVFRPKFRPFLKAAATEKHKGRISRWAQSNVIEN